MSTTIRIDTAAVSASAAKLGHSAIAIGNARDAINKANEALSKWTGDGSQNTGNITNLFQNYTKGLNSAATAEYVNLVKIQNKYTSIDEALKVCIDNKGNGGGTKNA
jgi:uncharacterized protein YukE